jgi:hypothetical protein
MRILRRLIPFVRIRKRKFSLVYLTKRVNNVRLSACHRATDTEKAYLVVCHGESGETDSANSAMPTKPNLPRL